MRGGECNYHARFLLFRRLSCRLSTDLRSSAPLDLRMFLWNGLEYGVFSFYDTRVQAITQVGYETRPVHIYHLTLNRQR